ncbi:hypothetical protein M153_1257000686 [Pseudoloma neurophilia]|uniref:Ricin B lectin domain-containing protein n=1 Tax=Pseudoloma neurophilia TaxID=146866 RepID=A0A0R0LV13_9MICR|nr:hypothetical protein M153_1257000686 [Pseudoloma neurophilia]
MFFIILIQNVFTFTFGDKYYSIQLLTDPSSKISTAGAAPLLVPGLNTPTKLEDPGVIKIENSEWNVFYFRLGDGYFCKHPEKSNMSIIMCSSETDPYTKWSLVKLDEYYQIRTHHRGLCLKRATPVLGIFKKERTLQVAPCATNDDFKWTVTELEELNNKGIKDIVAEKVGSKLDDLIEQNDNPIATAAAEMARSVMSRKFSSSAFSRYSRSFSS